jgi:integrase/recombinase XerC
MTDKPALVERYLAHAQFEKRLAARTVALYTEDLKRLQALAQEAGVSLEHVQPHHVRRWMAQMHSSGRTPRGIALIASGWRGLSSKADFQARQQDEPILISMGMDEQRAWAQS